MSDFDPGPGQRITLTVRGMTHSIQKYLSEHDLGMQPMLEKAVDNYLNGGIQREVQDAVNKQMPSFVESVVRRVLWGMRDEIEEVVALKIRDAIRSTEER